MVPRRGSPVFLLQAGPRTDSDSLINAVETFYYVAFIRELRRGNHTYYEEVESYRGEETPRPPSSAF